MRKCGEWIYIYSLTLGTSKIRRKEKHSIGNSNVYEVSYIFVDAADMYEKQ
jgi:hypothetical protein